MPPLPPAFFPLFLTPRGPPLKATQAALRRIGAPTAGTKQAVQARLLGKCGWAEGKRSEPHASTGEKGKRGKSKQEEKKKKETDDAEGAAAARKKTARVLSIDMGLRNLAFCVVDVAGGGRGGGAAEVCVRRWRRVDLVGGYEGLSPPSASASEVEVESTGEEENGGFTPSHLSLTAHAFLSEVMRCEPDVVLIERQRWRSGGAPAIQQWTVRVNTLEAIMWAILTCWRQDAGRAFDVVGVDPKRVAHFWLDGWEGVEEGGSEEEAERKGARKASRVKAEKQAKIRLLRAWLDRDNPSTGKALIHEDGNQHPSISFSFEAEGVGLERGPEATRQALLYATDKSSERGHRTGYEKGYTKKIDDLTDCFLQAAAWVAWEENLGVLKREWGEFVRDVERRTGKRIGSGEAFEEAIKELSASSRIAKVAPKAKRQPKKKKKEEEEASKTEVQKKAASKTKRRPNRKEVPHNRELTPLD